MENAFFEWIYHGTTAEKGWNPIRHPIGFFNKANNGFMGYSKTDLSFMPGNFCVCATWIKYGSCHEREIGVVFQFGFPPHGSKL